jgi:hypothetical protein
MALQLAAAAAEGCLGPQDDRFVTPVSSFTGPVAGAASSADRGAAPGLPGGMLPTKLVSAALPLLTQGPRAVRHAVQRVLLSLVPAAPQVRLGVGSIGVVLSRLAHKGNRRESCAQVGPDVPL